jgi:hypothetical protein
LAVIHDEGLKPLARVHIILVPARDATEIPAHLRYGGWNACPEPAMHVAVLRKWQAEYGAELVGLTSDTIQLRVARRPQTRADAWKLALEHDRYCGEVEDLESLAAELMVSDWWCFWWD